MTNKTFVFFILLFITATASLSCSESAEHISKRVFPVAAQQIIDMDARVAQGMSPRTFEKGKVMDAGIRAWTSGFFPGTAWYAYEYTRDEKLLELLRSMTDPDGEAGDPLADEA